MSKKLAIFLPFLRNSYNRKDLLNFELTDKKGDSREENFKFLEEREKIIKKFQIM